jgi:hypothetical protein
MIRSVTMVEVEFANHSNDSSSWVVFFNKDRVLTYDPVVFGVRCVDYYCPVFTTVQSITDHLLRIPFDRIPFD